MDLKELIIEELMSQRKTLMLSDPENFTSEEEALEYARDWVFGEEDILDKALESIGLTVDDIDPNDFRDIQNETCYLFADGAEERNRR